MNVPKGLSQDQIPVWLDCDPGHDDAFAILLAAHHPSFHLLGISTVHGNASLIRTTENASRILSAIGRPSIPVYPGARKPFCRTAVHAPDIHGISGLDGTNLLPPPPSGPPPTRSAVLAARDALLSTPQNTAWIVSTGALTNVALLLSTFPEVVGWIAGLSVMGGSIGDKFTDAPLGTVAGDEDAQRVGNVTQWAEFNIYCDPEAAQALFMNPNLRPKIILIPLDVTHLAFATESVRDLVLRGPDLNSPVTVLRQLLHDLLVFFASTYQNVFGISAGPPLHDPLAVAVLLPSDEVQFEFAQGERWIVEVVTDGLHGQGGSMVGRTIVRKLPEGEHGIRIPRGLKVDAFWSMLEQCIARAERYSE
ncbi:MAG: Uridine nucleosidase 1 [Piccolia ochrophora]|nr:MAG: Uridine nucleosidase 1 [Piccolia ochrophora]